MVNKIDSQNMHDAIAQLHKQIKDGLKLLDSKVETLRVIVETEEEKAKSQNVIGELKGTSRDDEIVIIGGHYDTVPNVSGAGDNAGGTSIVMELAKVFVEKGSRRTMRFIAWGAEEMGLRGSIFYAKNRLRQIWLKPKLCLPGPNQTKSHFLRDLCTVFMPSMFLPTN